MGKCQTFHNTGNSIPLADILLQEFHTRRNVIEEILHYESRTLRTTGILQQHFLATVDHITSANHFTLGAG